MMECQLNPKRCKHPEHVEFVFTFNINMFYLVKEDICHVQYSNIASNLQKLAHFKVTLRPLGRSRNYCMKFQL